MTDYKPQGHSDLSPYLVVNGATAVIDFMKTVFDAQELYRHPGENGSILHAEMRIGDTVVMLSDPNAGWEPRPAHVHVYVPDVDATYARALAAGAQPLQAPVRKEDPDKRGGVLDAGGTSWWISTRQA